MPINDIDLTSLSVNELNELISKARAVKTQKATPSIKINAYVASVGKHVNGALEAIKKLMAAEGVSGAKWADVEAQLARLASENYRKEADEVAIRTRARRGVRRKK